MGCTKYFHSSLNTPEEQWWAWLILINQWLPLFFVFSFPKLLWRFWRILMVSKIHLNWENTSESIWNHCYCYVSWCRWLSTLGNKEQINRFIFNYSQWRIPSKSNMNVFRAPGENPTCTETSQKLTHKVLSFPRLYLCADASRVRVIRWAVSMALAIQTQEYVSVSCW